MAKILIIDDDEQIRVLLQQMMEWTGYEVFVAENGKVGMQMQSDNPADLVITDLMMPIMDGFELCQHLKADSKTSHIPVVLLTAKADLENRIAGLEQHRHQSRKRAGFSEPTSTMVLPPMSSMACAVSTMVSVPWVTSTCSHSPAATAS